MDRDQRRLRDLPRSGLRARRLGAQPLRMARFGDRRDDSKGLVVRFDERARRTWAIDASSGNAAPNEPAAVLRKEVETCGLCHARRGQISEDWVPGRWLSDTHVVPPLSRGLYFADGQMDDEVYNYGSFKQSRMFAKGVTCSDCHDPHSSKLKLPGDGVCLTCHAPEKYAVAAHARHEGVNPPVGCPDCHMPTRTYMVVHPRHDHSMRIPRPDLSVRLGTPNACNGCHADRSAQWAADAVESWHGPDRKGFQHYAAAFHDAWSDQADAEKLLAAVASDHETPGFARAGALAEMAPYLSAANVDVARSSLADPDPMVRIGALDMLENAPPEQIWPIAAPLFGDPVLGVRVRAADLLAAVPTTRQPAGDRAAFDHAAAELVAAQELNADRPEGRLTLGSFYARRGDPAKAEAEYKAALKLAPQFAPAAVNLADLYRQTGRDGDGEQILRAAIATSPKRRRAPLRARPGAHPRKAIGRRARRVAPGGGARARQRAQRLCLCDCAQLDGPGRRGAENARTGARASPGESRDPYRAGSDQSAGRRPRGGPGLRGAARGGDAGRRRPAPVRRGAAAAC